MSTVHHETVYFNGHVQGVGFRYTTRQVAQEYEVAGLVENLLDGRVRLEVEGAREEVDAFINGVRDRLHGYIRGVERHAEARPPRLRGFVIR
jgi:acylphosphatase